MTGGCVSSRRSARSAPHSLSPHSPSSHSFSPHSFNRRTARRGWHRCRPPASARSWCRQGPAQRCCVRWRSWASDLRWVVVIMVTTAPSWAFARPPAHPSLPRVRHRVGHVGGTSSTRRGRRWCKDHHCGTPDCHRCEPGPPGPAHQGLVATHIQLVSQSKRLEPFAAEPRCETPCRTPRWLHLMVPSKPALAFDVDSWRRGGRARELVGRFPKWLRAASLTVSGVSGRPQARLTVGWWPTTTAAAPSRRCLGPFRG